jgi:DNA (cytosine-5)-methyltransferase 1
LTAYKIVDVGAKQKKNAGTAGTLRTTAGRRSYRLIDLFCGAGGMSLGFSCAFGNPFTSVWANDFDSDAASTYNRNFGPHCVEGDIISLLENRAVGIPKADVVIGGPPCQGFSLLNKGRADDPRKQMWRPFLEVVRRAEASVFVIENVPQILGSPEHEEINSAAASMGFRLTSGKLCAADYGVAQVRWRAFIIGSRFHDPALVFPPPRTHRSPKEAAMALDFGDLPSWRTVLDAIGDLPPPEGVEIRDAAPPFNLHFGRTPTEMSIARYRAVAQEGMNRFDLQRLAPELTPECWIRKTSGGTDLFGRLWWKRPAFTIRTEFYKPEKGRYLHPEQHRPITHREAARFQSFPDDFVFVGSKVEIAKQIGNAVPPLLAAGVARSVAALLTQQAAVEIGVA